VRDLLTPLDTALAVGLAPSAGDPVMGFLPCWSCDSTAACFEDCECAKCLDPEDYEEWKQNEPDEYQEWLASQSY
jgi:hypothetical protein